MKKKNPYSGLSQSTTKASGTSLTEANVSKGIKYFKSKAYMKRQIEEERARAEFERNFFRQMYCGDGKGNITSHSVNCICRPEEKYD